MLQVLGNDAAHLSYELDWAMHFRSNWRMPSLIYEKNEMIPVEQQIYTEFITISQFF